MNAVERSNYKQANSKRANETVRLKVYDVADELPDDQQIDEE